MITLITDIATAGIHIGITLVKFAYTFLKKAFGLIIKAIK